MFITVLSDLFSPFIQELTGLADVEENVNLGICQDDQLVHHNTSAVSSAAHSSSPEVSETFTLVVLNGMNQ